MESSPPKPHQLAALIRAWVDGATVQFCPKSPLLLEEWKDLPVVSECGGVAPMFNTRLFQYRIKTEDTSKPWRPKKGESFWLVGYDGDIYQSDALPNLNRKVIDIGNCFPASIKGYEEASAAAERFKAILKGGSAIDLIALNDRNRVLERENVSLKEDLKSLRTRCENLHKAKEALIASHVAIDGVTLTAGEIALIKALRKYPLTQVHGVDFKSTLIHFGNNGFVQTKTSHIAVWSKETDPGTDKALKDAFVKIQKEQEASNGNA